MTTVPVARTAPAPVPAQSIYQSRVADYWNAEENPVNLELGKIDDLYHHHYGIGAADLSVLDPVESPPSDQLDAGADYASIMRENLAHLVAGRGCTG